MGLSRRWRIWCALAYVVAATLAPGAHRHASTAEGTSTRCLASCRDDRGHVSGHPSPRPDHHQTDCPACRFQADHQAGMDLAYSPLVERACAPAALRSEPPHRPVVVSQPSLPRAPPRA